MRLTLLILSGFLLIAGGVIYWMMNVTREDVERQYSQAAEESLVDMAQLLASLLEQDMEGGGIEVGKFRAAFEGAYRRVFEARIYSLTKTALATHVYVTDAQGIVLFDSEGKREGRDFSGYRDYRLTIKGSYGARATRLDPADSSTTVFHVAAPITWHGDIVGVLTVMRPETAMAPFARETRAHLTRAGVQAALVAAFLGSLWTYWLVSPIGSLTRYARQVRDGARTISRPTSGLAELRVLRDSVEEMRHELEGRQYVENYVRALTHELKSPLAAIRGASELLAEPGMPAEKRARFLENIGAETGRCEEMIRGLLRLATLESRQDLDHREPLDFSALVRKELEHFAPRLAEKAVRLRVEGLDRPAIVSGDALVLELALRNVLSNAADFTPQGGEIVVSLTRATTASVPETLVLRVADSGPGVPDYAVARVFERFFSMKHAVTGRKGTGLGLCLTKEAIELHGGSVSLANRAQPSGGAEVVISLPLVER